MGNKAADFSRRGQPGQPIREEMQVTDVLICHNSRRLCTLRYVLGILPTPEKEKQPEVPFTI